MSEKSKADIIENIRKLLALAADGSAAPNEAATAARMAEKLMRKHNLEQSDVIFKELKQKDGVEMVWVRATTRKNAPRPNLDTPLWAMIMAANCAELFDCEANMRKANLKQGLCSVVCFYGYKTDVVVCAWFYEYLLDCVRRLAKQFELKANYMAVTKSAKSNREALDAFRYGAAQQIAQRLANLAYEKRMQDKQHSTSTALVVSKKAAIREQFGNFDYEDDDKPEEKNAIAMMHGRIAGSKVDLSINKPLEHKQ